MPPWSRLTLTNFVPPTLQISDQVSPRDIDKAWETDGASAANRIAKHAIQAAKRRVILFIPILKLYQREQYFVSRQDQGYLRQPGMRPDSLARMASS